MINNGAIRKALFRVGYYRQSVEGLARIGVVRNLFGRGKVIGVFGGGLSVTEKALLRTIGDPALPNPDKNEYLQDIAAGRIVFKTANLQKDVRPVIERMLAELELKDNAQAALDKLFPPQPAAPAPAGSSPSAEFRFDSASMVEAAVAGVTSAAELAEAAAREGVFQLGEAMPSKSSINIATEQDELIRDLETTNIEKAAAAAIKLLKYDTYADPMRILKALRAWKLTDETDADLKDLRTAALALREKLPLSVISGAEDGEIGKFTARGIYGLSTVGVGPKVEGGRVINEDGIAIFSWKGKTYIIICDGMGGHATGEVASQLAIEAAVIAIQDGKDLPEVILKAQELVNKKGSGTAKGKMGSTITIIEMDGRKGRVAYVGDSPVYQLKKDGRTLLLNLPHVSFLRVNALEVMQLIKGAAKVEEVFNKLKPALEQNPAPPYPESVIELIAELEITIASSYPENSPIRELLLTITYALGHKFPDAIPVNEFTLEPGDQLLAGSDGQELSPTQMREVLKQNLPVDKTVRTLRDWILQMGKKRDNVSIVYVRPGQVPIQEQAPAAAPAAPEPSREERFATDPTAVFDAKEMTILMELLLRDANLSPEVRDEIIQALGDVAGDLKQARKAWVVLRNALMNLYPKTMRRVDEQSRRIQELEAAAEAHKTAPLEESVSQTVANIEGILAQYPALEQDLARLMAEIGRKRAVLDENRITLDAYKEAQIEDRKRSHAEEIKGLQTQLTDRGKLLEVLQNIREGKISTAEATGRVVNTDDRKRIDSFIREVNTPNTQKFIHRIQVLERTKPDSLELAFARSLLKEELQDAQPIYDRFTGEIKAEIGRLEAAIKAKESDMSAYLMRKEQAVKRAEESIEILNSQIGDVEAQVKRINEQITAADAALKALVRRASQGARSLVDGVKSLPDAVNARLGLSTRKQIPPPTTPEK
jgi:serine/threonine protein phosphatase PrpC